MADQEGELEEPRTCFYPTGEGKVPQQRKGHETACTVYLGPRLLSHDIVYLADTGQPTSRGGNNRKRSPSPPSPGRGKGSRFDRGRGTGGGCARSSEDEALAEQRDKELQHMQTQRIVKEAASPRPQSDKPRAYCDPDLLYVVTSDPSSLRRRGGIRRGSGGRRASSEGTRNRGLWGKHFCHE